MFSNTVLDVFIGLVFIFLLYSLLATIVQEVIAVRFAFRSKVLEKAILRMLEDGKTTTKMPYGDRVKGVLHMFGLINQLKGKSVAPWFYAHPLIKYLAEDNYYSKPAYLDATSFSKVMIDLLKGFDQPESATVQAIHNSITKGVINKMPINISNSAADKANPAVKILRNQNLKPDSSFKLPDELKKETVEININTALYLRSLWQESGADVTQFRVKLEHWFDDTMERATGWYKRYTQLILFILGFTMAVAFNIDTIAIHRLLSKDKTAREQLVQMAVNNKDNLGKIVNQQSNTSDSTKNDTLLNSAYNMVLEDAKAANQVIGLGRPWSDTCKLCDAINAKYQAIKDSLSKSSDSINKALTARLNIYKDSTLLLNSSIKTPRKQNKRLKQFINARLKAIGDSVISINYFLAVSGSPENDNKFSKVIFLKSRCDFIKDTRDGSWYEYDKWFKYSPYQNGGLETLFGWIITALAISLGAPFWFDLLNKFIKLRGTGTKITSADVDTGSTNISSSNSSTSNNPANASNNSDSDEEAVG